MNEDLEPADLYDDAACDAASDLTARLLAELSNARAQLAVAEARAHAALAAGHVIPLDVRHERVLARQKVAVLRQVLDGVPSVEDVSHAASA